MRVDQAAPSQLKLLSQQRVDLFLYFLYRFRSIDTDNFRGGEINPDQVHFTVIVLQPLLDRSLRIFVGFLCSLQHRGVGNLELNREWGREFAFFTRSAR